jgi:hypothetical protein
MNSEAESKKKYLKWIGEFAAKRGAPTFLEVWQAAMASMDKASYDVMVQIGDNTVQFSSELLHAQVINGKHCLQVKVPMENIDSYKSASSMQPSLSKQ